MLTIQTAKNKMENREGMNHLLTEIEPEKSYEKVTKPCVFVLLIDKSGSMIDAADHNSGNERTSKMSYVIQASNKFVDMMRDGDMLGITTFSNISNTLLPLTTMNQNEKTKAKQLISGIRASGGTNISDAMESAYSQISEELKKTHHIKFILLSDGEANNGITETDSICTLANNLKKGEVSISTIGVGIQYNAYFMESIATSSGGMFYHLEKMSMLNEIFTQELETMATLTTKHARIKIKLPAGMHAEKNLNAFQEDTLGDIYIGNVFSKQSVLIEFFTKEKMDVGTYPIQVIYEYIDANGAKKTIEVQTEIAVVHEDDMEDVVTNQTVVKLVQSMLEAKAKKEAIRNYEMGDIHGASANLMGSMAKLSSFAASYSEDTSATLDALTSLNAQMSTRSLSQEQSKSMYSRSYSLTRNKKD